MRHGQVGRGQVEEYCVDAPVELVRESVGADVPVVDGDVRVDPVRLELVARQLAPLLVEVERVQVAGRLDRARERVRQRAAAGARLDDGAPRPHLELEQVHADVWRVDDLRPVRQRLRPQLGRRLQHVRPPFREGDLAVGRLADANAGREANSYLRSVLDADQVLHLQRAVVCLENVLDALASLVLDHRRHVQGVHACVRQV